VLFTVEEHELASSNTGDRFNPPFRVSPKAGRLMEVSMP